jgi:hypothetical protein
VGLLAQLPRAQIVLGPLERKRLYGARWNGSLGSRKHLPQNRRLPVAITTSPITNPNGCSTNMACEGLIRRVILAMVVSEIVLKPSSSSTR